jgi:hypothetical protein
MKRETTKRFTAFVIPVMALASTVAAQHNAFPQDSFSDGLGINPAAETRQSPGPTCSKLRAFRKGAELGIN